MVKIEVVKILAVGCNKRFMWINHGEGTACVRIGNALYQYLKFKGVPTAQSMRNKS